MSKLDDKTFIVGVGAQKAGTSWLFKYLDNRADTYMSPIKELHYFDMKHRPSISPGVNNVFFRALVERVRSGESSGYKSDPKLCALVDRVSMIYDQSAYSRFFEDRVPADVTHFGEITPAYSTLDAKGFEDLRSQFPKIRVMFLLRDPINRHYSLMRMKEKKGKIESANKSFLEMLKSPNATTRGLYHETIEHLQSVFKADEVFYGFYETLFCDEEMHRICDFAGLPFQPGTYSERVNSGPTGEREPLSDDQIAAAREVFAPVYDFCRDFFGDKVPSSWHA